MAEAKKYRVFFIIKNSMLPFLDNTPLPPHFENIGVENHILMGLRCASYNRPDIIFLDGSLPYMGVKSYIDMLAGTCSFFRIILFQATPDDEPILDPHIACTLHSELSAQTFCDALNLAAEVLDSPSKGTSALHHPVWKPASSLLDLLERHDGRSISGTLLQSYFIDPVDRGVYISLFSPDQVALRNPDSAAFLNQIPLSFSAYSNTYLSVIEGNCIGLITTQEYLHSQLQSALNSLCGRQCFYYTNVFAPDLAHLADCYYTAKQHLALSFFEQEDHCLDHAVSEIITEDQEANLDRMLCALLIDTVGNQTAHIVEKIDTLYLEQLRSSYSLPLRDMIRSKISIIYHLCGELSVMDSCPPLMLNDNYLTQEALSIESAMVDIAAFIDPRSRLISPYVLAALCFIRCNYFRSISLREIASQANVSPTYISALFKASLNISISDYLTKIRIEQARELLYTTDQSICEIAAAVGIEDSRYFSRVFRKICGTTPTGYRSLNQEKGENTL